jgi:flagellar motor protein MotB
MGPPRRNASQAHPHKSGSAGAHRKPNLVGALAVFFLAILLGTGCYGLYALRTKSTTQLEAAGLTAIAEGIRSRLDQAGIGSSVSLSENADRSRLAIRVEGMFAPGQYVLNQAATPPVIQVGSAIAAAPGKVLVHLTGYTDDTPFEKTRGLSNQTLSTLRAQNVMQVLATTGVSPEHITVSGSGEASPLDDNHTREGRARNRRVEIIVEPLG